MRDEIARNGELGEQTDRSDPKSEWQNIRRPGLGRDAGIGGFQDETSIERGERR